MHVRQIQPVGAIIEQHHDATIPCVTIWDGPPIKDTATLTDPVFVGCYCCCWSSSRHLVVVDVLLFSSRHSSSTTSSFASCTFGRREED